MPHKTREARNRYWRERKRRKRRESKEWRDREQAYKRTQETVCRRCGKAFLGRKGAAFCSRRCAGKWMWEQGKQNQFLPTATGSYKKVRHNGRVTREHRVVMESALQRPLRSDEVVHHKNGDRADNRLGNLSLTTSGRHARKHMSRPRDIPGDHMTRCQG